MDAAILNAIRGQWTAETVRAWVAAAQADGWAAEPTYQNEPITSAVTLRTDGWVAMVLLREYKTSLFVWGPDRMSVVPPPVYDATELDRRIMLCTHCGEFVDRVVRVSFARRVCEPCRAVLAPQLERHGWTD